MFQSHVGVFQSHASMIWIFNKRMSCAHASQGHVAIIIYLTDRWTVKFGGNSLCNIELYTWIVKTNSVVFIIVVIIALI